MEWKLLEGDCLELMKQIPDNSIDMILADLPYGTIACKWDTIIPFEPLWEQYNCIIKPATPIILTAGEPFASHLRLSNLGMYQYDWIWGKVQPTGAITCKRRPMQQQEYILVFYNQQ